MSTTNKLCGQVKCITRKCRDKAGAIDICINSSYSNEALRTAKLTTTKDVETNLNCNCMIVINNNNCCNQNYYNQTINNSSNSNPKFHNNNKNIFSIKLFKAIQQEHQRQELQQQHLNHTHHYTTADAQCICHYRHHHYYYSPTVQKFSLRHSFKMKTYFQDLMYALLCTLLLLIDNVQITQAGCRYEPTRSCEAICRPIWGTIDNSSYQTNAVVTTNNVTLENFYAGDYNCTIRALVLMPDDDRYVASLKRVVPILQVAEQRIRASGLLPSFVHFDWMPQDDKCDAAFAAVKAMDGIVKNCSHVIFGPVCDYSLAAVARIAKYFNSHGTPLISVGGSTFDFEKPKTKCSDEFYMLLRTGMLSFESISELTISVMKRNKWSRSIFFYDADGQRNVAGQHTCYLMMTSLGKQMRNENMTFAQYRITEKLKNRTQEMTREIGNKNSGKCKAF